MKRVVSLLVLTLAVAACGDSVTEPAASDTDALLATALDSHSQGADQVYLSLIHI